MKDSLWFVQTILVAAFIAAACFTVQSAEAQQRGMALGDTSLTGDSAADGYDKVLPTTVITFPDDYGRHDGFRLEWWYVTATLESEDGEEMGIQWTLFRSALRPPKTSGPPKTDEQPAGGGDAPLTSPWSSNHVWMAHAAVTTADGHRFEERFSRGVGGEAGATVTINPNGKGAVDAAVDAWLADWQLVSTAPDQFALKAAGKDFSYDLQLTKVGDEILQGDKGYSVKAASGQASHYFSHPFLAVTGDVMIDGRAFKVMGDAWLDREWSSQFLSESQSGWEWFAIRFEDGRALTLARVRDSDQGDLIFAGLAENGSEQGTKPLTDARLTQINQDDVTRWRIDIPSEGISITTQPLNPDSWNRGLFPYFEGPIGIKGSHAGRGYLEMTGYQAPKKR